MTSLTAHPNQLELRQLGFFAAGKLTSLTNVYGLGYRLSNVLHLSTSVNDREAYFVSTPDTHVDGRLPVSRRFFVLTLQPVIKPSDTVYSIGTFF